MAHLSRTIRTPHAVLVFHRWDEPGETMLWNVRMPSDWLVLLVSGAADLHYPVGMEPPAELAKLPGWDPAERSLRTTLWGAYLLPADSRGLLIRSAAPDTRVVCFLPLSRAYLAAAYGPELADLMLAAGVGGPIHESLTSWHEAEQVDPKTLVRTDKDGAAVVDVEFLQSVALNDLTALRSAPTGTVVRSREVTR